jgi:hypothetical protein
MDDQKKRTKDVLDRLKAQEATPKPKFENLNSSNKKTEAKKESEKPNMPQSIYQIKLEKIMNRLNELERKMKSGNDYFTYYWEYSKSCKEFNETVKEFDKFETSFVPAQFKKRVDESKSKVTAHLNRKIPESRVKDNGSPKSADDLIDL